MGKFEIDDRVQFALESGPVMLITSRNEDGSWDCEWWSEKDDCFKLVTFEDRKLIPAKESK